MNMILCCNIRATVRNSKPCGSKFTPNHFWIENRVLTKGSAVFRQDANQLLTSDGRVTTEENQLLSAVKAAFQL